MRKCQCGRLKHEHKHNLIKKIIHYKMDTDTTLGPTLVLVQRVTCFLLLSLSLLLAVVIILRISIRLTLISHLHARGRHHADGGALRLRRRRQATLARHVPRALSVRVARLAVRVGRLAICVVHLSAPARGGLNNHRATGLSHICRRGVHRRR